VDRTGRALVWIACFAVGLAPLFPVRDLPLIDLPNHLAHAFMWQHWDDPAWGFQACYTFELGPLPYTAYHGFLRFVGELVPIHVANKIWMGLSAVGLGGATAYLLKGLGRPPVLALAILPVYWSGSTVWGFCNFMAAQTVLVFALALLANGRFWIGMAVGTAIYFVHPIALAAWIGLAPIVAPGIWRRIFVSLPGIAAFVAGMTLAPRANLAPRAGMSFVGHWPPWEDVWHDFPQLVYGFVSRDEALLLLGGVGIVIIVGTVLVEKTLLEEPGRDLRPLALVAMAALYHFALPRNIDQPMELAGISSRFPPLLVIMAITLVPRGAFTPVRTAILLIPLLGTNLWHGSTVAGKLSRGRGDELSFHHIVERLPPRAEVLLLLEDRDHPGMTELNHVRTHQQALIQIERGGYDPQGWDHPYPIVPKEECKLRWPPLEQSHGHLFKWEVHGVAYRWFVVRGDATFIFGKAPVERVATDGAWALWKRTD
jgi:hypothetical protein